MLLCPDRDPLCEAKRGPVSEKVALNKSHIIEPPGNPSSAAYTVLVTLISVKTVCQLL